MQAIVQRHGPQHPHLQRLADAVLVHVDTPQVRPSVVFVLTQMLLQHDSQGLKLLDLKHTTGSSLTTQHAIVTDLLLQLVF